MMRKVGVRMAYASAVSPRTRDDEPAALGRTVTVVASESL
jgi:hypothetical protein